MHREIISKCAKLPDFEFKFTAQANGTKQRQQTEQIQDLNF